MDRESNFYKRTVLEMIHIKEQKVGLNLNNDSELLDDSYFNILNLLLKFLRTLCIYISIIELSFENFSLLFLTLSQQDQIQSLDDCYYLLKIPNSM